jgi:hypothetical protein
MEGLGHKLRAITAHLSPEEAEVQRYLQQHPPPSNEYCLRDFADALEDAIVSMVTLEPTTSVRVSFHHKDGACIYLPSGRRCTVGNLPLLSLTNYCNKYKYPEVMQKKLQDQFDYVTKHYMDYFLGRLHDMRYEEIEPRFYSLTWDN